MSNFDTLVPVHEITPIVRAKKQEVVPEKVHPVGGQKDVERITLVEFGLALGMDGSDFKNPEMLRKLARIKEAAIQEAGTDDQETLIWQATKFRTQVGAPALGVGLVDHLYQYSRLLMDRNLLQMQLGSMQQGGSGSPSSSRTNPSTPNSPSRTPTAPSVNVLIGVPGQ